MKQLNKILTNTNWATASNTINNNNDRIFSSVSALEHAAFKQKGYYKTLTALKDAYPYAESGSQAFVYNASNGSAQPYDIYEWDGNNWVDTGVNGGSTSVNLDSKQDTIHGYTENVTNGRVTQIALQADTIVLGGKASIGQIGDVESSIMISSQQASNAIAKANTLEQSINALKSPVKPIHLNSQGKLELSVGKGLYIEEGKLCATGASSSGGGGGKTYSEGNGIIITDDTINVNYDADTMCINDCGGLAVNIGEGFIMKDGKLSVQASVNAGNGLVKKGEELQVSVGTGLLVQDDVYVNLGKGLATDNENKVNVNLDEQTLTTDSSGKVIVNKDSLIGNGLKQEFSKLAVNYGTGLTLSNKAIVVNYGTGLSIQDGKLVSTAQGGKTYIGGQAIDISGNEINVKYDGVTISTKDTADNSLHVMLGSGLTQGTNGIDVAVGSGLAIGEDNKLYSTVSSGKTYTAGNGINISGDKIAVKYGSGLTTDTCGGIQVAIGSGLAYDQYDYGKIRVKAGDGIIIPNTGEVKARIGNGLAFDYFGAIKICDSVLADIDNLKDSKQNTLTEGDGIRIIDDKINVAYDLETIVLDDCGGLAVNFGSGLEMQNGKLCAVRQDGKSYTGGDGISVDNTTNEVSFKLGTSLESVCGFIQVAISSGLEYDDYNHFKIRVKGGKGIDIPSDGTVNVALGQGLGFDKWNELTLSLHEKSGLQVTSEGLGVNAGVALGTSDGKLNVQYGTGLTIRNTKLVVDPYSLLTTGGGLCVDEGGLNIMVGNGLTIADCSVAVNYGTGLSVNSNKIYVDTSKIAGTGIDLEDITKKLTIGTKAAEALAGEGLVLSGAKLKVDAASVFAKKVIQFADGEIVRIDCSVERSMLLSIRGTNTGRCALVYISGYGSGTSIRMTHRVIYAGSGYKFYYNGASELGAFYVKNNWGVHSDTLTVVEFGTYAPSVTTVATIPTDSVLVRDTLATLDEVQSIQDLISSTYATKEELSGKQDALTFGNGLATDGYRTLYLPNLIASVVNGAVDKTRCDNQKVLELSCGAITVKLSTGLGIDENGYLYVKG